MTEKSITCQEIFLRDSQEKLVACIRAEPFVFQVNDSNEIPRFGITRKDGEHPVFKILHPNGHTRFVLAFVDDSLHLYSGKEISGGPLAELKYDQKDNTIHIKGAVNVVHTSYPEESGVE